MALAISFRVSPSWSSNWWRSHLRIHFAVHGSFSGSTIECCGSLPEPSSPGPQLCADLGSWVCGRVGSEVAGVSHSFCQGPQLPSPSVFLSHLCRMAVGTDTPLRVWDGLQVYAFPPFALFRWFLDKLTLSTGTCLALLAPFWPQYEWFLCSGVCWWLLQLPFPHIVPSSASPLPSCALAPPCAEPSCVETVQRFTLRLGLSRLVARQLALCRSLSCHCLSQRRWDGYRACGSKRGRSISSPSVPLFLPSSCFFHTVNSFHGGDRVSRTTLISVFQYRLLELFDSFSSEFSSAPLRSSVPVIQWSLPRGTLSRFSHTFVAPPLGLCVPSLCAWSP